MNEVFRQIPGESGYEVSQSGIVRNRYTKRPLTVTMTCYLTVPLGQRRRFVHRLVAMAWVVNPDPDRFNIVNHLDGDHANPAASNLEWTTTRGNNEYAARVAPRGPRKERAGDVVESHDPSTGALVGVHGSMAAAARSAGVSDKRMQEVIDHPTWTTAGLKWIHQARALPQADEEWRRIDCIDEIQYAHVIYAVSNFGKIRNDTNGRELVPTRSYDGYLTVFLTHGSGMRKLVRVHRAVASVFSPHGASKTLQVDHINKKRDDNRASNLQWITVADHAVKTRGLTIEKLNLRGESVAIYPTLTAAAREHKISISAVSYAVKNQSTCAGHRWRPVTAPPEIYKESLRELTDEDVNGILSEYGW